jgi:hypothetical protein
MAVAYFRVLTQNLPEVTEKTHDDLNCANRPPGQQSNPELFYNEAKLLTKSTEPLGAYILHLSISRRRMISLRSDTFLSNEDASL